MVDALRRTGRILLFLALCVAAPLRAESRVYTSGPTQKMLIELFTSEGCSSCPPADKWLGQLANDPRLWREIIPVAYHVDYWNYLGWRDPFSSKRWSQAQRLYRQSGGISSVYTPEFVVNGREWRGWFGSRRLPQPDAQTGILEVSLGDGVVSAKYAPVKKSVKGWKLHVAVLGMGLKTSVTAGENAGKELSHDFVVLNQVEADSGQGQWELMLPSMRYPQARRLAFAAWVTKAGEMTPVQAVGGWLR